MGAMKRKAKPEVAVVVPLEDPRGEVVEHLRTWTRHQELPRDRFQMILGADGKHPEFEERVTAELADQDELVRVPGASLMGLYDAGARAATAPVLVLTEAHVRAEPGCLAAVAEAFAREPDLDAATIKQLQSTTRGISTLSERWFARCFEAWDREDWVRFNTTGVAITGEAYARVGGLEHLGLYAPSLLSARLDEQGVRIAHLEDAVLTHELEDDMAYSLELGANFARGECIVRREQDPEFCERYFGPAGLWERRHAYRHEIAGSMVAALTSAIRRSPGDRRWLARELAVRVPARVAGARPRLAWERATTRLHQAVAAAERLPEETRWRSYVQAQEGTVRGVQLEELAKENGMPPAPASGDGIEAVRLDGILIGAHGLEREGDREFRWAEPVALVRLGPLGGDTVLRIETGGLRGDPLGYLHGAYAGSSPVPRELVSSDGETLEIRLPQGLAATGATTGLVLISRPLVPTRNGSTDDRRLGMPVSAIELSSA